MLIGISSLMSGGCSVVSKISTGDGGDLEPKGPQTAEDRKVDAFDKIQAGDAYEINVTLGKPASLKIEAPKDLLPHLSTVVKGGELEIKSDVSYSLRNGAKVIVTISVPSLTAVNLSGASAMQISGMVKADDFKAEASGASTLRFSGDVGSISIEASGSSKAELEKLTAKKGSISASGASNIKIDGACDDATVESTGSSKVEGNLMVKDANVQTSGAAHASLTVSHSLKGDADGSSSIVYSGSPDNVEKQASGAATIEHR